MLKRLAFSLLFLVDALPLMALVVFLLTLLGYFTGIVLVSGGIMVLALTYIFTVGLADVTLRSIQFVKENW